MDVYQVTHEWLITNGKELIDRHYEEVPYALRPDSYEINLPLYQNVENLGNLLCLVAMDEEGELAGYVTGMVGPMLHSASEQCFLTSAFYTVPEKRKQGVAKLLYSELMKVCEHAGVDYVHYTVNATFPEAKGLVESLGMQEIETTYSVKVGG